MKEMSFCPTGERQLSSYLEDRLNAVDRDAFASHARGCEICQVELNLWDRLATLPAPPPPPNLERAFQAMLRRETSSRVTPIWQKPALGWAAAAILALGGFFVGAQFGGQRPKSELEDLRSEMRRMKTLVAMSLLQQQSAVERLRGVNYSGHLENPEEVVVTALVQTLRSDSSIDVRLAAADALRKYSTRPKVSMAMVDALQSQDSPMMQLALIDTLVELQDRRAELPLRHLARETSVNPAVKQRIEKALRELKLQ